MITIFNGRRLGQEKTNYAAIIPGFNQERTSNIDHRTIFNSHQKHDCLTPDF